MDEVNVPILRFREEFGGSYQGKVIWSLTSNKVLVSGIRDRRGEVHVEVSFSNPSCSPGKVGTTTRTGTKTEKSVLYIARRIISLAWFRVPW